MITGSKDDLDAMIATHKCPEHENPLVTAWHAGEKSYVIRCGAGHFPLEIQPVPSLFEEKAIGTPEIGKVQDEEEKRVRTRKVVISPQPTRAELSLLPRADVETGEVLSPAQQQALITYAERYGLDAYRGHVIMMRGKPYIGLDGYLYHAAVKNIPYSLTGHPLTGEELKQRGYGEGDIGWHSRILRLDNQQEFEGEGFVTAEEREQLSKKEGRGYAHPVVHDKPGPMCQKRSRWAVLRQAFPIGEIEPEGGK